MKKSLLVLFPLLLCSCSGKNSPNDKEIVIGVSPTPHAEIMEVVKPLVESKGYKLTIKVFNDYVTPNLSLDSGDLDANYFQHTPYLDDFNKAHKTDIVGVCKVHFEPMGIYSMYNDKLNMASYPAKTSKIIVPNDTSNKERAMALLNEKFAHLENYSIVECEAQAIPSLLSDCSYACINGNYALSSGVTNYCLSTESNDSLVADRNANIIAVKNEYKDYDFVKVLKDCVLTDTVRDFIQNKYGSSVKAVF